MKTVIAKNIYTLRMKHHYSQDNLSEIISVSRQTIAKWEAGQTLPDINHCNLLAQHFNVSLDDLVNYDQDQHVMPIPPKGKHYFGLTPISKYGFIKIPNEAIQLFHLDIGDQFAVLVDENSETRGIALVPEKEFIKLLDLIQKERK